MFNRRRFLEAVGGLPLAGSVLTGCSRAGGRDYFAELGVRTFLNAAGTYTTLTASLMPPEVRQRSPSVSGRSSRIGLPYEPN